MNPTLIRQARLQRPFRSFYLKANDGRRFPVLEPEHVLVTANLLVVVDPDDRVPTHVSPELIDAIEFVEEQTEDAANGHKRHS